jgi:2-phospho-L-lactate guanylyltransferase (CobY/MobA/RfbA family)
MLEDVPEACRTVAEDVVVASGGGGQGEAVEAALRRVDSGPILVVNADLPAAQPRDLLTLVGALPENGLALVAALAAPHLFAPLYGPGSVERFLARATRLDVPAAVAAIPEPR